MRVRFNTFLAKSHIHMLYITVKLFIMATPTIRTMIRRSFSPVFSADHGLNRSVVGC